MVDHKRLFVVVPPNAEFEEGFESWVNKLIKLSVELSIPINLYCTEDTHQEILNFAKRNKINLALNFHPFSKWEDFRKLLEQVNSTDFIILVSARRGYVSHFGQLDRLPAKLERRFPDLSKVVIYPR